MVFTPLLLVLDGDMHHGGNVCHLYHTDRRRLGPRTKTSHKALSLNVSTVSPQRHRLETKHLTLDLSRAFQIQSTAEVSVQNVSGFVEILSIMLRL